MCHSLKSLLPALNYLFANTYEFSELQLHDWYTFGAEYRLPSIQPAGPRVIRGSIRYPDYARINYLNLKYFETNICFLKSKLRVKMCLFVFTWRSAVCAA
jgi:hypothetical protein